MATFQIQIDHTDKILRFGNDERDRPFIKIFANEGGAAGAPLASLEDCGKMATFAEVVKLSEQHGFAYEEMLQAAAYHAAAKANDSADLIGKVFGEPWRINIRGQYYGMVRGCVLPDGATVLEVVYAVGPDRQVKTFPCDGTLAEAISAALLWLRQHGLPEWAGAPNTLTAPPLVDMLARTKALNAASDELEGTP